MVQITNMGPIGMEEKKRMMGFDSMTNSMTKCNVQSSCEDHTGAFLRVGDVMPFFFFCENGVIYIIFTPHLCITCVN